jgi:hypothetical protein
MTPRSLQESQIQPRLCSASDALCPTAGPRRRSPRHPDLISLAGAVGSATGLSLRSPRAFKIFFRAAGTGAGFAGAAFLTR